MLIEWLNRHYFIFPALLLCIALIKIAGSFAFFRREDGIAGILLLLFRWYSVNDYHVRDAPWQIRTMKWMNIVSLFFYSSLTVFIAVTAAIKLLR